MAPIDAPMASRSSAAAPPRWPPSWPLSSPAAAARWAAAAAVIVETWRPALGCRGAIAAVGGPVRRSPEVTDLGCPIGGPVRVAVAARSARGQKRGDPSEMQRRRSADRRGPQPRVVRGGAAVHAWAGRRAFPRGGWARKRCRRRIADFSQQERSSALLSFPKNRENRDRAYARGHRPVGNIYVGGINIFWKHEN